jgi:hypothetical protein
MNEKEKLVNFNKKPSLWQWKIEIIFSNVIIQMCGGKKQSVLVIIKFWSLNKKPNHGFEKLFKFDHVHFYM